jgi:hypothetical protein
MKKLIILLVVVGIVGAFAFAKLNSHDEEHEFGA